MSKLRFLPPPGLAVTVVPDTKQVLALIRSPSQWWNGMNLRQHTYPPAFHSAKSPTTRPRRNGTLLGPRMRIVVTGRPGRPYAAVTRYPSKGKKLDATCLSFWESLLSAWGSASLPLISKVIMPFAWKQWDFGNLLSPSNQSSLIITQYLIKVDYFFLGHFLVILEGCMYTIPLLHRDQNTKLISHTKYFFNCYLF